MEKIVIIGSGPAGLTAAIYAARGELNPLLIAGSLPGGLLTQTTEVENFPGFPDGINGYELMAKMQQQAEKFGTRIEYDAVERVELVSNGIQKLHMASGKTIETEALIISTGASPRYLGLESEERLRNKGVSACATCDGAFYRKVPVVVIGGGDSAMEEAIFLTNFASEVTVIHRRDTLRASKIMADRAMANPKIKFAWNSTVLEVLGENEVEGVKIQNIQSGAESVIPCKGYFAALGHIPNTMLFRDFLETDEHGYIKAVGTSARTAIDGVFVAGDCADPAYRQAITAAGSGCRAAMDAEKYLAAR